MTAVVGSPICRASARGSAGARLRASSSAAERAVCRYGRSIVTHVLARPNRDTATVSLRATSRFPREQLREFRAAVSAATERADRARGDGRRTRASPSGGGPDLDSRGKDRRSHGRLSISVRRTYDTAQTPGSNFSRATWHARGSRAARSAAPVATRRRSLACTPVCDRPRGADACCSRSIRSRWHGQTGRDLRDSTVRPRSLEATSSIATRLSSAPDWVHHPRRRARDGMLIGELTRLTHG
jgi:hypothetical protein